MFGTWILKFFKFTGVASISFFSFVKSAFRFSNWCVYTAFLALWGAVKYAFFVCNELYAVIAGLPSSGEPVACATGHLLQFVNAVFPLEEAFAYMTLLFQLYIACTIYRAVKSWIPTVS